MMARITGPRPWNGFRMLFYAGLIAACSLLWPSNAFAAGASGFEVNTVLQLDSPLLAGEYVWDERGVPAGPIRIVVDLEAQRLYVYRAGAEIGRSSIMYGDDNKPTPTGTFSILQKDADHYSNIYDGAPMPYMLRLTNDGISIHGADVDFAYATHGCIGVPKKFAAILFSKARLGDRVLITNNWMPDSYYGF